MKIRTRAYLLGLLPAFLIAAILGGHLIMKRLNDLDASLKERGGALVRYLAQGIDYAVVSGNQEELKRILAWTILERDVIHVGVYRPMASSSPRRAECRARCMPPCRPESWNRERIWRSACPSY
jgi:flagellar motor component MotA